MSSSVKNDGPDTKLSRKDAIGSVVFRGPRCLVFVQLDPDHPGSPPFWNKVYKEKQWLEHILALLSAESWGNRILWLELMAGFLLAIGRALSLECPTLRNYIERNTEINLDRIALKRLPQTPWKQKINIQQEKVSRFYYFLPLFWTIPYDRSLLRNVMLTVPRELGLPGCGVCFPKSCINEIRRFKSTTKSSIG